jgi:hypothetical protein
LKLGLFSNNQFGSLLFKQQDKASIAHIFFSTLEVLSTTTASTLPVKTRKWCFFEIYWYMLAAVNGSYELPIGDRLVFRAYDSIWRRVWTIYYDSAWT